VTQYTFFRGHDVVALFARGGHAIVTLRTFREYPLRDRQMIDPYRTPVLCIVTGIAYILGGDMTRAFPCGALAFMTGNAGVCGFVVTKARRTPTAADVVAFGARQVGYDVGGRRLARRQHTVMALFAIIIDILMVHTHRNTETYWRVAGFANFVGWNMCAGLSDRDQAVMATIALRRRAFENLPNVASITGGTFMLAYQWKSGNAMVKGQHRRRTGRGRGRFRGIRWRGVDYACRHPQPRQDRYDTPHLTPYT